MSMERAINMFSAWVGCVGGILVYCLGGIDKMMRTLLILIVLDYLTGVLKAVYQKKLNSAIGFKGIIKKVIMLIVVAACVALQNVLDMPIREIVITFFVCNEGLSILENSKEVIPLPQQLIDLLDKTKGKEADKLEDKE